MVKPSVPVRDFFINLGLVFLGILFFSLSFPNLLVDEGLPLLAWFAYAPVFFLIRRTRLSALFFWGALYGYGAYSLFNYWLFTFHPLASLVASSVFLLYFLALFPLLKIALILFPKKGYLVQYCIWLGFEYLRTLGFLGYSYGITGYTQWRVLPLIQIAALGGVWLVSALVLFPSVFLGAALPLLPHGRGGIIPGIKVFFKRERPAAFFWLAALVFTLIYGFASPLRHDAAPRVKIALIQQNTDPWKVEGPLEYAENLAVLKRLSREALAAAPDSDLVVWPETAFIPRIYWHLTYRDEPEYYPVVKDLMDFLSEQTVPFVLGNDDARKEVGEDGNWERVDYNGVLLFEQSLDGEGGGLLETGLPLRLKQVYHKVHLVPFTEHFPYKKQFPALYRFLTGRDDIHFWKAGRDLTVFSSGSLRFSTPVCFEDTFGSISREFVKKGAEILVNLSNDSWSKSLPAQNQHLAMAVFRSVENRRPLVRSTVSGQTCAIDPGGKVLALAKPFTETWLNAEVPLSRAGSLYTFWGDIFGIFFSIAAAALLLTGTVLGILRRTYGHS